jgi:hypothetical protein
MLRIVIGLMPKDPSAQQGDDDGADADAAPPKNPAWPPEPPPARRSSTLADSRLPSHFMRLLLR